MRRGDGTEVKARQGSVDGVPLAAQMQAEEVPEVRKGCAAQAFGGERAEMGRNVGKKKRLRTEQWRG